MFILHIKFKNNYILIEKLQNTDNAYSSKSCQYEEYGTSKQSWQLPAKATLFPGLITSPLLPLKHRAGSHLK